MCVYRELNYLTFHVYVIKNVINEVKKKYSEVISKKLFLFLQEMYVKRIKKIIAFVKV